MFILLGCNEASEPELNREKVINDITYIYTDKMVVDGQTYLITKYVSYGVFVNNLTLDKLQKEKFELEIKRLKNQ